MLGCRAAYGLYDELQQQLGGVIRSMTAAFKTAEFAAELKNRLWWSQSKIRGYESPPLGNFSTCRLGK